MKYRRLKEVLTSKGRFDIEKKFKTFKKDVEKKSSRPKEIQTSDVLTFERNLV